MRLIYKELLKLTEAMYLMMKNVFENLGYRRYEWKCDALNKKSNNTALRLGFKHEGKFRQATIYKQKETEILIGILLLTRNGNNTEKNYRKYLKRSNFNNQLIQKRKLKL